MNQSQKRFQHSKRKEIRAEIKKVEKKALGKSNHEIFREYWRLGLKLIHQHRRKEGLEFLDSAISYKEESQHSCVYHQLGVYNKLLLQKNKKSKNNR